MQTFPEVKVWKGYYKFLSPPPSDLTTDQVNKDASLTPEMDLLTIQLHIAV